MANKIRNLYVDDTRDLPPGYHPSTWEIAKTYNEAIELLSTHEYETVSLDHDLGCFDSEGKEQDGGKLVLWLIERKLDGLYIPPKILVHSANPVRHEHMVALIERYL